MYRLRLQVHPIMRLDNPTLIGNRYFLQQLIGEGGQGNVYHAVDRLTGQSVALKRSALEDIRRLLSTTQHLYISQSDLSIALAQEFRTLATLHHPNIIGVLDYGFDAE